MEKFLGQIPIFTDIGKEGDKGKPIVESMPEHQASEIYNDFAKIIKSNFNLS